MKSLENLHKLACKYKHDAKKTGHWASYLKAHGLANCCVAKDPTDDNRRLVYEIENQWYNGGHPLSFSEHEVQIKEHKQLLQTLRDDTKQIISSLKDREQGFNIDNIFSEYNLCHADKFVRDVFNMSKTCSDELARISKLILEASVDVVGRSGMHPPPNTSFAVIGLGSIARGIATPFSDLEYAFIVQSNENSKYFERLAVDSYFRIGNLGETPLSCFNIEEIPDGDHSWDCVLMGLPRGYRIDGISDWAGNIPTGNPGKQSLTLTIEQLVDLYKNELQSDVGFLADKSDLLSSTELIYHNEGGKMLYRKMKRALALELQQATSEQFIARKRLQLIGNDVDAYDFLPQTKSFGPPDNSDLKVKSAIFRYPTLLADHLKLALGLTSSYPWDAHSDLKKLGLLSDITYRYLNIILGLSIYIRTSAYLALGTQSDKLSLYTYSSVSPLYHVPRNVFVVLGTLLTPVKLAISLNLERISASKGNINMSSVLKDLLYSFVAPTSVPMLKAEVLYFTGDYDNALKSLYAIIGKDSVHNMSTGFLALVHQCEPETGNAKLMEMCCFLLWSAGQYDFARVYLEWLTDHENDSVKKARWKVLTAECLNKTHYYQKSAMFLQDVITWLRSEYRLKESESVPNHVLNKYVQQDGMTDGQLHLLEVTVHTYRVIGDTCLFLKLYTHGEEVIQICSQMCESLLHKFPEGNKLQSSLMNSLGRLFLDIGKFDRARECYTNLLELRKSLHGQNTNHPDLAECWSNFGEVDKLSGNFQIALAGYDQALELMKSIHHGNITHMDLANCYSSIGDIHGEMGHYEAALQSHFLSLSIKREIYSNESDNPDVASSYSSIGRMLFYMELYKPSFFYQSKAFHILVQLNFGKSYHPDLSNILRELGKLYTDLREDEKALVCEDVAFTQMKAVHEELQPTLLTITMVYSDMKEFTKSLASENVLLNTKKLKHGRQSNHPDIATSCYNIGSVYHDMGEYTKALDYLSKCLKVQKVVYGSDAEHPSIATNYNRIGAVYRSMGEYTKALEHCSNSLAIREGIYGSDTNHPFKATSYNNIGSVYDEMGKYSKALEYYFKCLDILKIVYCSDTNHPFIATSCNNIGSAYNEMGEYRKALENYSKCLDIRKAIYGSDSNHPSIAESHSNIGTVYVNMGEYARALEYYFMSLDTEKAAYGSDANHPSMAASYSNIGSVCIHKGEFTEALEHFSKCLDMQKIIHRSNTNHPSIATSYNNIGSVYDNMGEYSKALEYYSKCLDIEKAVYGNDANHPSIATSYNNIGLLYDTMEEYTKALEYYLKSLDISKAVYGSESNHPSIAVTYNNIGLVYDGEGDYAKALEYYFLCLDMEKVIHSEDANHPSVARTYNNIGCVYKNMGEYSKALEYHSMCLAIEKAVYGCDTNHPSIARTYNNIGSVYDCMKEYTKALSYYCMCLNILEIVYAGDTSHPYIAANHNNIGSVYYAMGKHTEALESYQKCVDILNAACGDDFNHPFVAKCYSNIATVRESMGE